MREKIRFQDFCYQIMCKKAYLEALNEAKLHFVFLKNNCFLYNVKHSTDFESLFSYN
jgi:hypothetical protein